jgi:hypothetical protein
LNSKHFQGQKLGDFGLGISTPIIDEKESEFREFYVQAGAGSNFLASKCLWAGSRNNEIQIYDSDVPTNEFFYHREKVNLPYLKEHHDYHGEYILNYVCDDEDLISAGEKIKPILIELDKWITDSSPQSDSPTQRDNRNDVINYVSDLWRRDWSMYTVSFFDFDALRSYSQTRQEVSDMVTQIQDYFAQCREYYYKICNRHGHDLFIITHAHPYVTISPRLLLPNRFKSLGMELDREMELMTTALQGIKSEDVCDRHNLLCGDVGGLHVNRNLRLCDETVSYRKIFFENDRYEVMKLYEFFDNKAYFHKNRSQIMKEFKEYHDANMAVIKQNEPSIHKKIK